MVKNLPIMRLFIQIDAEIDDPKESFQFMDEIGSFLAKDIEQNLDNGEDYIEVKYLQGEIV